MAELAFEVVVRVFIAIIVLSLVSVLITYIFQGVEKKIENELAEKSRLPIIIDGIELEKEDFEAYAKKCRDYYFTNTPVNKIEPCFVFKRANQYSLGQLDENVSVKIEVKSISTNAIMSYDVERDVVIIE